MSILDKLKTVQSSKNKDIFVDTAKLENVMRLNGYGAETIKMVCKYPPDEHEDAMEHASRGLVFL